MPYQKSLDRLQNILTELRAKCPWDKKQTIHTLSTQTIEELYELIDAIAQENWDNIKEELGDLLLHLLFYSKIATEQNQFSLAEVIEQVCNKLVRRHPHIYEMVQVKDETEVKKNWEQLKLKEGKKSIFEGVPQALPALVKAYRLQDKAKQIGFDWDNTDDVYAKFQEEWKELQEALANKNKDATEEELGDVLFSIINYARHIGVNPEQALERTNQKFKKRFELMEELVMDEDKKLNNMSLIEMDKYWVMAKNKLKSNI